jgi:diguanylate cyclase (GGDEF)-like protein/PAS domain S-box-containing protein
MFRPVIKSLRTRLIMLIILAVIPALIHIFYTSHEQRQLREAEINKELMSTARLAAHSLDQLFSGSRQLLVGIATLRAVRDYDADSCNAYLSAIRKNLPMYASLSAVKPDGDVFCSAYTAALKLNVADRPYFQLAVREKGYVVGEYLISRTSNKPAITVALPVLDRGEAVRAVVYASIDLGRLMEDMEKIKISQEYGATLTIVDRNLTILYRNPGLQEWIGKRASDTELSKKIDDLKEGIVTAKDFDGVRYVSAFTTIEGLNEGIRIRYSVSQAAVFSSIDRMLAENLIALLAITLLSLIVAWFGSDYFVVRRMRLLQKAAADLGKGDLKARVKVDGVDEIGRLGNDFNKMAEELESRTRKLQISEEKYRTLFEESKDAVFISTPDGRYIDINPAGVALFGYASKEEMLGLDINTDIYCDPKDRQVFKQTLEEKVFVVDIERRVKRRDGKILTLLSSITAVRDEQGNVVEYRGISHDITERKQAEKALRDAEKRFNEELQAQHNRLANTIEATGHGVWEWNIPSGEIVVNDRWAEIIGYPLTELSPIKIETWERLAHPDDRKEVRDQLNLHFERITDYFVCEFRMRHKNGAWIWIRDRGKVIERDAEGCPLRMYGTIIDITEKKAMEERIRELSIRDPLTGVYNRRHIFKRLDEIGAEYSRRGRNFCVSILDIDHFKAVNDTYGHQAGDFVLKEFAHTISAAIRQYDLFGRYGGEEFIIVSPSVEWPEIAAMVGRIMGMMRDKAFSFEGHEIRCTFSCGLADSLEFERDQFSIGVMISLADERLYAAKEEGRDRLVGP